KNAETLAPHLEHVHKVGYGDGFVGEERNRDRVVPQGGRGADPDTMDIAKAYGEGYREGVTAKQALVKRASELGWTDGLAANTAHRADIMGWPEVKEHTGSDLTKLTTDLYAAYAASQKRGYQKGIQLIVDKVEKRAYELGLKDGKAGSTAHMAE